jgi:hypothetical protein
VDYSVTLKENQPSMKQGIWQQVLTYLYLRKRDPNDPRNIDIKLMHGMNRISIFVFLIAIVVIIIKAFLR